MSGLCWVGVLSLVSVSSLVLRSVLWLCVVWNPDCCDHWRVQVKCVSEYWELTFRNRDVLGGDLGVPQEGGKQDVLPGSVYFSGNGDRQGGEATAEGLLQRCGEARLLDLEER